MVNIDGVYYRKKVLDLAAQLAKLEENDIEKLNELATQMASAITIGHTPTPEEPEQVEVFIAVSDQREVEVATDMDTLLNRCSEVSPYINVARIIVNMPVPVEPDASTTIHVKSPKPLTVEAQEDEEITGMSEG